MYLGISVFVVKPGETIAFVGATGSGKSTIINLVNKFYKVGRGQILIDGKDINSYESESLRSRDFCCFTRCVFCFQDRF